MSDRASTSISPDAGLLPQMCGYSFKFRRRPGQHFFEGNLEDWRALEAYAAGKARSMGVSNLSAPTWTTT
jgi:diketogulonate reductase-like aldo/keto reductase